MDFGIVHFVKDLEQFSSPSSCWKQGHHWIQTRLLEVLLVGPWKSTRPELPQHLWVTSVLRSLGWKFFTWSQFRVSCFHLWPLSVGLLSWTSVKRSSDNLGMGGLLTVPLQAYQAQLPYSLLMCFRILNTVFPPRASLLMKKTFAC